MLCPLCKGYVSVKRVATELTRKEKQLIGKEKKANRKYFIDLHALALTISSIWLTTRFVIA